MPEKPARNAPCPCGSGKKYKRCHGLTGEAIAQPRKRSLVVIVVFGLIAIGAGVAVTILRDWKMGLSVAGGVIFLAALYMIFRNPPPPNPGAGDAAGLNFGR